MIQFEKDRLETKKIRFYETKMEISETTAITYPDLDKIGTYKKELGRGTFGVVRAWTSNKTNRTYAVKKFFLSPDGDIGADAIREIAILRALKHPNIIQILDVGNFSTASNTPIAMVLPLGLDDFKLFTSIPSKIPFNLDIYKKVGYQLCLGLAYLHDKGVIHRDLKPGNIIVLPGYIPVISDFGSARFGAVPGGYYTNGLQTSWWRAPEMFLSLDTLKNYDSKIDVFSMGVVLMELFCDVYPLFSAKSTAEVLLFQIAYLGHFNEESYPGISKSKAFEEEKLVAYAKARPLGKSDHYIFNKYRQRDRDGKVVKIPEELRMLLLNMTFPNPKVRVNMNNVLASSWWNDIRDRNALSTPSSCGKSYRSTTTLPVFGFIKDETVSVRRVLMDVAWDFAQAYEFSVAAKMHYRFIYEEFRHKYNELLRNVDPLLEEIEPFSKENMALVMFCCCYIASMFYDPYPIESINIIEQLESNALNKWKLKDAQKMIKSILKVLRFDVAFNTYDEYNYALLQRQSLKKEITDGADIVAKVFYIMEVERHLDSERLARISLELACRAHRVPNPQCLIDSPFSEEEVRYYIDRLLEFNRLLMDKKYSTEVDFRDLKKSIKKLDFIYIVTNINADDAKDRTVAAGAVSVEQLETLVDYDVPLTLKIDGMVGIEGDLAFERALAAYPKQNIVMNVLYPLIHNYAASTAELIEKSNPGAKITIAESLKYFNLERRVSDDKKSIKYSWNGRASPQIDFVISNNSKSMAVTVTFKLVNKIVTNVLVAMRDKISIKGFPNSSVGNLIARLEGPEVIV